MSVRCKHGGPAPCIDDLCHNGETTLCGIPYEEWSGSFDDDDEGVEFVIVDDYEEIAALPFTGDIEAL